MILKCPITAWVWIDGWAGKWVDEWESGCGNLLDARMDGWMDDRMDGWMDEWSNGWMDGWMIEWMDGWMNDRMDGWMYEWSNGWMEWMKDGWRLGGGINLIERRKRALTDVCVWVGEWGKGEMTSRKWIIEVEMETIWQIEVEVIPDETFFGVLGGFFGSNSPGTSNLLQSN